MRYIIPFFKSMKLRVFLIIIAVGLLMTSIADYTVYISCRSEAVSLKLDDVNDYVSRLTLRMIKNVYFASSINRSDISRELDVMSQTYRGRIITTDSASRVIYDSYGTEVGKTLISAEAISALNGQSSRYTDYEGQYIELSIPVIDQSDSTSANRGALYITFSIEDEMELSYRIQRRLLLATVVSWIMLLGVAVWASVGLTRPFKKINYSLQQISDGNVDEKVSIRGFSEMQSVSDSLNEMLSRIRSLEESRQEFVANVSHELKTPITSVRLLADSLLTQPDAPLDMYKEFMTDINNELTRESDIINDLLELVKLDKKHADLHVSEVNINDMIAAVLKSLLPIAQKRGVELIYESFRNVIAEVDEIKLSRAVTNLIENGIKYNRDSGGWVKVTVNSDHKFFIITVADSGIGIPAEALEHIFERFYRVDKARSRESGGTGLGLAITRSVVQLHNGAIKVESVPEEGTVFTVRIPFIHIRPDDLKG